MSQTQKIRKGDRVYWWYKDGHAYSSAVANTEKRYGIVEKITRKRMLDGEETAEIRADDAPGHVTSLTTYVLHKD